MASFTQIVKNKRSRRHRRAGAKRKHKQGERSTASYGELFAGCGEPKDASGSGQSGANRSATSASRP